MRRALIVIDVQNDYFNDTMPIEYPDPAISLANIAKAMDAAHTAKVPVVVVQNLAPVGSPFMATGSQGAELHPIVKDRPYDLLLLKSLPSCFAKTELETWLQEKGITCLTVCGYMTHNCVDSTIRPAMHLAYKVEFLEDAAGSVSYENSAGKASAKEIHELYKVVLQSRFAAVMDTATWIAGLQGAELPSVDSIYKSNQRARGLNP
jgi:nicotinamidase-related amidase